MGISKIIGISVLVVIWVWLVWMLIAAGGFNLKNLLIAAMSGIIIFVPLYKKYVGKK